MENYEQKYKDALSWMKDLYPTFEGATKEDAEHYFPELKESEDEKIRKEIISFLKEGTPYYCSNTVRRQKWATWFEKQSEKIDAIENFDTEFEKQVSHLIASAINKEHEYNHGYVKWTANALLNYAKRELEKQGEQKYAWNQEDEDMLKSIIATCKLAGQDRDSSSARHLFEMQTNWLKSLKRKI